MRNRWLALMLVVATAGRTFGNGVPSEDTYAFIGARAFKDARRDTAFRAFPIRAFHLDLRIQVMKMPALRAFAERLHQGGINTLILEYEATYPFEKHPLISNRYAYTLAEIRSFIACCDQLGIDVIPLQQSFGHVEYILRHTRYRALREDPKDLSQVCPLETVKDSLLFTDLYTELVSTHHSPYLHIGCDETHLLGSCPKCHAKVEKEGLSKLYIDYVRMLCNIVIRLGKRPVLWADIALKYPEAIRSLPKETIFVDWNYGWDMNNFGDHEKLMESGFEIWGAPALRSSPDDQYLTQWEKHFKNIRDFVPEARQMGYKGIVLTSWSTSGTYSYLYESEDNLTELYAIRHVYPITGFNILLAAYMKSIRSADPLNIPAFVASYGEATFGFNKAQTQAFRDALMTAPYEVSNGQVESPFPVSLPALTDSCVHAAKIFHALQPLKNGHEFEQFRLMADLRIEYLRFLCIEQAVNDPGFSRRDIPAISEKLRALLAKGHLLSRAFIELNKESFYVSELQKESQLPVTRIQALYDRLHQLR